MKIFEFFFIINNVKAWCSNSQRLLRTIILNTLMSSREFNWSPCSNILSNIHRFFMYTVWEPSSLRNNHTDIYCAYFSRILLYIYLHKTHSHSHPRLIIHIRTHTHSLTLTPTSQSQVYTYHTITLIPILTLSFPSATRPQHYIKIFF